MIKPEIHVLVMMLRICNNAISSSSCSVIKLGADINGKITFNGISNKILDGQGHSISGSNYGIWFSDGTTNTNITIENCNISGSYEGIGFSFSSTSTNITIIGNLFNVSHNYIINYGTINNLILNNSQYGNYYGKIDGTGYSDTCDIDWAAEPVVINGVKYAICDSPYEPISGYTDYHPLTKYPNLKVNYFKFNTSDKVFENRTYNVTMEFEVLDHDISPPRPVNVTISDNGKIIYSKYYPTGLEKGKYNISFLYNTTNKTGIHVFDILLDPENHVPESNESDNLYKTTITILGEYKGSAKIELYNETTGLYDTDLRDVSVVKPGQLLRLTFENKTLKTIIVPVVVNTTYYTKETVEKIYTKTKYKKETYCSTICDNKCNSYMEKIVNKVLKVSNSGEINLENTGGVLGSAFICTYGCTNGACRSGVNVVCKYM